MTDYPGPPPTRPNPEWQPRYQDQCPQPRQLPALDGDAVDHAERTATKITLGVGTLAALIVLFVVLTQLG